MPTQLSCKEKCRQNNNLARQIVENCNDEAETKTCWSDSHGLENGKVSHTIDHEWQPKLHPTIGFLSQQNRSPSKLDGVWSQSSADSRADLHELDIETEQWSIPSHRFSISAGPPLVLLQDVLNLEYFTEKKIHRCFDQAAEFVPHHRINRALWLRQHRYNAMNWPDLRGVQTYPACKIFSSNIEELSTHQWKLSLQETNRWNSFSSLHI